MLDALIATSGASDRVAGAFLPAYRAALRALVPDLGDKAAALCVTEERGNHPRQLRTRWAGGRLTGEKAWATAADSGEVLLICAVDDSRPQLPHPTLVLVVVPREAPGLTLHPMPPTPFVPEVPHFRLSLDEVPGERLPGDGWTDYVKPFRTLEDIHVTAALHAFWLGVGERSGWPATVCARLTAQLAALTTLAAADPSAAHTHLALGGVFAHQEALLADMEPLWAQVETEVAARWARDRMLMKVASTPRKRRFEQAVAALSG